MSRTPRIEVYLNDDAALIIAHHRLADRGPLEVPIPLNEVMAGGHDEAAKRLGSILLHILMQWHREEFARTGEAATPATASTGEMETVHSLISKSISLRTNVHVASIEHLLSHSVDDATECREFLTLTWPMIRAELVKYGNGPAM